MKYTQLGRTGLKVSRLCLGTMNFGPHTKENDSFSIMDKSLELGFNFFDTADVYGWKQGEGITEKIVGKWLAQGDGRRERIVLSTKVYGRMDDGPNGEGLSAYRIRRACEESLKRLKTDHIDLYQMHHIDRNTPWDEIWQAMEQLVREGKVIYVGSSNFSGWQIAQANGYASSRHFLGLVSEQSVYNLNNRMIELEVIPTCREFGLGLIPWSPLAGGLLSGSLDKVNSGRRKSDKGFQNRVKSHQAKLEAFESLCKDMGEPPANDAIAWLLHNPVVTAPIIGPRTIEQLEGIVESLDITLSEDILKKLDEIWPGPGGEAPEAYAW